VAGDVALRVEARTVVADFERDPLELSCQLYLYVGCAGVLDGIVQCFLGDAVEGFLGFFAERGLYPYTVARLDGGLLLERRTGGRGAGNCGEDRTRCRGVFRRRVPRLDAGLCRTRARQRAGRCAFRQRSEDQVGEQRFYPSIGYRRRSIGTRGRPPRSPDHKSGRGSTTLDRQPDLTKGRAIHHQVDLQSRSVRDVEVSSSGRAPDEIQLHS